MEIRIDYYIGEGDKTRIMHHTVTEQDIIDSLEKKFREGELGCPMSFDRETDKVKFVIDKVIV